MLFFDYYFQTILSIQWLNRNSERHCTFVLHLANTHCIVWQRNLNHIPYCGLCQANTFESLFPKGALYEYIYIAFRYCFLCKYLELLNAMRNNTSLGTKHSSASHLKHNHQHDDGAIGETRETRDRPIKGQRIN